MKRVFAFLLAAVLLLSLAACSGQKDDPRVKSEGVMTNEEYDAASNGAQVAIEAYVQGKQVQKDGKTSLYLQDIDGAYFVYDVAISDAEYAKLKQGQKVKVTGKKATDSGEIEITDAEVEILKGNYIAEAADGAALLSDADLLQHQNERVFIKGLTVLGSRNADGAGKAVLFKWDGSGQDGDDLYFNAKLNGKAYSFTVETDLCAPDSEVYQTVKGLQIGDRIDVECFLYWHEGLTPQVVSVTPAE